MKIFESDWSKDELRRRMGSVEQIAGIRTVTLEDANEWPQRAAMLGTGGGLEMTVLLSRGMDIASARHNGRPLAWRSVTGDVAPAYYEPEGLRWLRSFQGGLVTTCGMTYAGAPPENSAETGIGLHGRINNIPARNIQISQDWHGEEYVLRITGTMREASVFGENLTLTRTITTKLGEKRFWILDRVRNEGFRRSPFMFLYHCNIGWPAVDAGSRVLIPSRAAAPRDATAADGHEQWRELHEPRANYAEKVYYHDVAADSEGYATAAVVNAGFDKDQGFGVYVKYRPEELPRFAQWKQLGEQEYVVGLEPCNCGVTGRATDEQEGLLDHLEPGEERQFHLELGAVTSASERAAIADAANQHETQLVQDYRDFVKPPKGA